MTETPDTRAPEGEPRASTPAAAKPYGWQMSEEERQEELRYTERAEARDEYERRQYGWALFAVTMLVMAGGFQFINGLIALFRSGTYQVGRSGLAVNVDYTAWGWVHIILGVLAGVAAFGLMGGHMWARILGVVLATVSAIVYMGFIAAFPALSLVVIALDVLVIYAITVHGKDLKEGDY